MPEREAADAFAGGGEDGVEHRRCGDRDGGLADAAPEPARGHDDGLDLGHLGDQHRRVGVEVLLLDPSTRDGAFAVEERREPEHE